MRIISKFHDYYDGIQAYGVDLDRVYLRRSSTEKYIIDQPFRVNPGDFPVYMHFNDALIEDVFSYGLSIGERSLLRHAHQLRQYLRESKEKHIKNRNFSFHPFLVGFCGSIFPGIRIAETDSHDHLKNIHHLYTNEDVENAFGVSLRHNGFPLGEEYKTDIPFLAANAPIVLFDLHEYKMIIEVTKNPCLADYEFYRIKDPFTTYQEIAMYLESVLVQSSDDKMISISDNDMVQNKGFDKWSFRKMPTKRKSEKD